MFVYEFPERGVVDEPLRVISADNFFDGVSNWPKLARTYQGWSTSVDEVIPTDSAALFLEWATLVPLPRT